MVVKLTGDSETAIMQAIGCTGANDFASSLTAFITKAQSNETFMAESKVTLETLAGSITALEGKLLTEDRVKAICGESTTTAIATWAGSEAGKKIIGAESSRICMETLGNVGTTPVKPAPAGTAETEESKVAGLIAEGKFEDAWKADKGLRTEFITSKSYAAYMRNRNRVRETERNN